MAPITYGLPNEPFFHHLMEVFGADPGRILIDDPANGVKANYARLLTDMLYLRREIRKQLPEQMFDAQGRISKERPFISIIAPGNYDYLVAAYATLALGGAIAAISNSLMPEEACHLLQTAGSSCLLISPQYQSNGSEIMRHWLSAVQDTPPVVVSIKTLSTPLLPAVQIDIDEEMKLDPSSPGALFFTSGTTGPPKGVVHPRRLWYLKPELASAKEAWLIFRPPNWIGVATRMIRTAQAGMRMVTVEWSAPALWERLRLGDITGMQAPPAVYAAMMTYFQQHIDGLPEKERSQYINGVGRLREPLVSGGVSWPTVTGFWQELLGRPLKNRYGCTEASGLTATTGDTDPALERCVGKPYPGVEIKLSDGDSGEILVKSRSMFTHYLGNEAATKAAFDDEGYFKSGDFGHRVGDQYVIDGRASHDFIRFCGLRVPIHELEALIVSLPYISEAYVVSATYRYMRQIAILVKPSDPNLKAKVSLQQIREDLRGSLQQFKLPSLLRILPDGEAAPQTRSSKPDRREIARKYFSIPEEPPLPEGIEFWDGVAAENRGPRQMWDWGGMGI